MEGEGGGGGGWGGGTPTTVTAVIHYSEARICMPEATVYYRTDIEPSVQINGVSSIQGVN